MQEHCKAQMDELKEKNDQKTGSDGLKTGGYEM